MSVLARFVTRRRRAGPDERDGRGTPGASDPSVRVTVETATGEILSGDVDPHQLLLRASRKVGVKIENLCANRGLCMTCAVTVTPQTAAGLTPAGAVERRYLDWVGAPAEVRLSCQAEVVADVEIRANLVPIDRWNHDPSVPWWLDVQHDPPIDDR